jgi:hypothetical protein
MKTSRLMAFALTALLVGGCAASRPVLYPNATLEERGDAQAALDIDTCLAFADAQGVGDGRAGRVARSTAQRGAGGAAAGAAGGAIAGNAGRGAAIGAATSATWGLFSGLFRSNTPDPLYQNFVNICLQELGYRPIGWR